jgi:2-hydroxycyclohexanecarboxyl-CoA dehydrogenase
VPSSTNAGVISPTRFLDVTDAEWDRIFDVNVRGSYLMTKRVVPGMADRGFGRVVNLSSVSAQRGGGVFGGVAYSAAKAALLGFSRALARELGPSGVTVNAVAPGLIDADITAGKLSPERKAAIVADIPPTGRTGTVEDVANVIGFLCRLESSYITGATYDINGGSHIHLLTNPMCAPFLGQGATAGVESTAPEVVEYRVHAEYRPGVAAGFSAPGCLARRL